MTWQDRCATGCTLMCEGSRSPSRKTCDELHIKRRESRSRSTKSQQGRHAVASYCYSPSPRPCGGEVVPIPGSPAVCVEGLTTLEPAPSADPMHAVHPANGQATPFMAGTTGIPLIFRAWETPPTSTFPFVVFLSQRGPDQCQDATLAEGTTGSQCGQCPFMSGTSCSPPPNVTSHADRYSR